jgi:hypothetical protein
MGSRWEALDWDHVVGHDFPQDAGVYAFICNGRVVYVGSSVCLARRIKSHGLRYCVFSPVIITPWGRFDSVVVKLKVSRRYGDWLMDEARLLHRLKPVGNINGVSLRVRVKPKSTRS